MPRQKRNAPPGSDLHTIFRSIDNSFLFHGKPEQNILIQTLYRMVSRYRCKVYAWVGMSNHHHIFNQAPEDWPEEHALFGSGIKMPIGHMFRDCFSLFARWINFARKRVGGVIRDRTKTVIVKTPEQSITLLIYIFLNPVRAGIVEHPRNYPFHNFHMYAYGTKHHPGIFTFHPAFIALGKTWNQRRHHFLSLVEKSMRSWGLKKWKGISGSHGPGRNQQIKGYETFDRLANFLCMFTDVDINGPPTTKS